jgi:hypothetical protein
VQKKVKAAVEVVIPKKLKIQTIVVMEMAAVAL